ncbi:sensor histidine kinase [Marinicrinis lubricantis]|uniref:histidine kinase n=1 Tax=Marinicrinis lubricantis TaxID=2086470 RepID=A0ABW1IRZ7_9BACL
MKALYRNLRIKHKLFILISFVLLAFSGGCLAILQYAFKVYNEEFYRQSAQALNVSSNGIENELRKMERLSYRISTDPMVQSYLMQIQKSVSLYQQFVLRANLKERMIEIAGTDKYILSAHMFDVHGNESAIGNQQIEISRERMEQIKAEASLEEGGNRWVFPDGSDRALIAARAVRSYENLELERLGTLTIRLDLEEIFSDYSRGMKEGGSFLIWNGEQQLYPHDEKISSKPLRMNLEHSEGYQIVKIEGDRYFVTYAPSGHTEWTYMILTPYDNLFQTIVLVRNAVLGVLAASFIIVMFIAFRFARSITIPIERLNMKMKKVQLGNFQYSEEEEEEDRRLPMDESGQMHRNFRMMLQRINELIKENYESQLVMKDSEFKALQAQINPHFLYNTLDSIHWTSKMSGELQTARMAECLGYLLRNSISFQEPIVSLEHELKILDSYITIQKYRFEERLNFHNDIPTELYSCTIPKMTLQPLVENAIRYGVEQQIHGCEIRISAVVHQNQLLVTVSDDGPGMEHAFLEKLRKGDAAPRGTGIGLRNIQERIQMLFGDEYGIYIESERFKGTQVQIRLPYERGIGHVQSAVGG